MNSFSGKTILVTGASSGIGRELGRRTAELGAKIIGVARNSKNLQEALRAYPGGPHQELTYDLNDTDGFSDLVAGLPQLNGVVLSAGEPSIIPSRLLKRKQFDSVLLQHLVSPVLLTTELIRSNKLVDGGSVVFLSSLSAVSTSSGILAYGAAKAGLTNAAMTLTAEYTAKNRFRFNCVCPGMIATPFIEKIEQRIGPQAFEKARNSYPLGFGKPADVASLIAFLLSDESSWISGSSYRLDGGHFCAH